MDIQTVLKQGIVLFITFLLSTTNLIAGEFSVQMDAASINLLTKLLAAPEEDIDFAEAKLAIDQLIDPTIDVAATRQRLDSMVVAIMKMTTVSASSMEKKEALRKYLYESVPWNNHQAFQYDFDDPKGTNINNKLINSYLNSRKGNCISMPFLFIVLGQKLGLDVVASTAPLHVFVKYTDDATGITYNLETTSGGNPTRDSWVRQGFPMTDMAVRNGIYLQKLTNKETVAVMANALLQHYFEKKQFGQLIATADLILSYYPKAVSAIIYKASTYNELLKVEGLWRYRTPREVPPAEREKFKYLISRVNGYHNQAIRMGWHQPSEAENENYLKKVEQEAARIN